MTAKDLKNALLQEAVQGKLVPQIASEGNAKDLLEEIKKEKAKLIKEGKLKKEKPLPEITEDDIPFDIPENWCWCRLGEICHVTSSKRIYSQDQTAFGIPFLRVSDLVAKIQGNDINTLFISEKTFFELKEKGFVPKKNDILVTSRGTLGLSYIVNENDKFYFQDGMITWLSLFGNLTPQYICTLFSSNLIDIQIQTFSNGTAVSYLSIESIRNLLIPLPPLAEQKRIVAAIEQFTPLIEEYGKKEAELTALNADIAKTLKNAILQEAVQGKLAPQIASEGNAKDLLEEIKKEKAKLIKEGKLKKEKPLPEITEDEIPFDIPENWCWCRLGDLCKLTENEKITNIKLPILDAKYLRGKTTPTIATSGKLVKENDYIILVDGENSGEVFTSKEKGYMGSTFKILQIEKEMYHKYILLFIRLNKELLRNSKKGAAIPHLNKDIFFNLLLPLPPIAEQKRIVVTIEQLLPLCKKFGE